MIFDVTENWRKEILSKILMLQEENTDGDDDIIIIQVL